MPPRNRLRSLETLATAISHLIDIPLILWRTVNSILGRLSGWFTVASVVGGAMVGAFFGGVGAIPGALAGLQVAGTVGLGLGISAGGELLVSAQKAFLDLYGVPQTPEEQDEDYDQLGTSAIGLAVLVVLLALAWIVSRIVGAMVQAVGKTRFGQWARTTWDDLRRPGARGSDGETSLTTKATHEHVHQGGTETDPQSPYRGKWDGKGIHDWDSLQARCQQDGYNITEVTVDPDTGVRRVEIERVGIDPRTNEQVTGKIKKTVYPPEMSPAEIDAAGEQALRAAQSREANTKFEPFGTKTRKDGTPADGYFEADVPGSDGRRIRVQGWFKENPDGTRTISSHAPRYDKNWPILPPEDW